MTVRESREASAPAAAINETAIELDFEDGTLTVRVDGEIDLANATAFDDLLRRAIDSEMRVILDLRALRFIDSTGLRCLLIAGRRSRANGDHLRVLWPTGDVGRMMEVSGIAEALKAPRAANLAMPNPPKAAS